MYDLIIIGGGPGGVAAGVYAARKRIKTLLITDSFGGQSLTSADIQNWIGTKSVSGYDLGRMLEEHLRAQEDIEIIDSDKVTAVSDKGDYLDVSTEQGKTFQTKYLLIASGSRRRKLGIPGERELDGKGVVYCSTCDAPLFKGKVTAVVGGGNAGLEAGVDLLPYAEKIYLIERSEAPKGDAVTLAKLTASQKFELITMAEPQKVLGDAFVLGLEYLDRKTNETKKLDLQGVFVEIGAIPNSEFVKDKVTTDKAGDIVVDHKTQKTSHPRIWAIGDVSDVLYKQNNISAGDAVKAVLNIYDELNRE
jgi:alkyl hydroperoxide reductase subunit F